MSAGARRRLERVLGAMDDIVVAVSGGVDSLTLAVIAGRAGSVRAGMAHAVSPAVPPVATARVRALARAEGWRLEVLDAGEFEDERYLANPLDRCRHCKRHLYDAIRSSTDAVIASGTNTDDLGDFRPGLEAAAERGVRHPYVEAGIDKAGVRALARAAGLGHLAELPAAPCLSSRIETGVRIEPRTLEFVDRAERAVRAALDAAVVRARVRREGIVIELDPEALARARRGVSGEVERALDALLDVAGLDPPVRFEPYRMGSAFLRPASAGRSP